MAEPDPIAHLLEGRSPDEVELIRRHSLTSDQIAVFDKLRADSPPDLLSDFRWIQLLCAKKTYEKCLDAGPRFRQLLDDIKPDEINLDDELYLSNDYVRQFLNYGMIWFPNGYETLDGVPYMQMDYGKMVKTRNEEERDLMIQVFVRMMDKIMHDNPKVVTDGLAMIFDCGTMGLRNFDFAMEKKIAYLLRAYPVRSKLMVLFDAPWYVNLLIALIKPFYTAKIMRRMFCVKKAQLERYVAPENMIREWGGEREFSYEDWMINEIGITAFAKTDEEVQTEIARRRAIQQDIEGEGEISEEEARRRIQALADESGD